LVIDDDPGLCRLLTHCLQHANYRVVAATSGAGGLTLLDRYAIDLVILDLIMPHMDGFSTCAAIRARSAVAILVLSALTGQDVQTRVRRSGANAYLAKPPRLAELHRVIQALLGQHPACTCPRNG
jgi:DNA-binding response OmpR family regulator